MSIRPWHCEKCKKECAYLGIQVYSQEDEAINYGVGWGCPTCDYKALDVCPLGPVLPDPDLCLNCATPYPPGSPGLACPGCGLTPQGVIPFLRITPHPPPDPAGLARDQFSKGLFRRGLAILNQALVADLRNENAWLVKCSFLEGVGLQSLVISMLEGALAAGAPLSLLINYGSALHQAGRYEDAAMAARRYLEREPNGAWAGAARTNLGVALRMLGDDAAAEDLYREAMTLEPSQILHYRNLAQLLMDQKRWAGALGALEKGLSHSTLAEDRMRFLEGLAFVYAEEDRGRQALQFVEQAMELGAHSARTHYLRGRALALLGRLEEAREEMHGVLENEPANSDARQALELIEARLSGKPG